MTADERKMVAAWLIDRAHRYRPDSPVFAAFEDAADEVSCGEIEAAFEHGELDDLLKRLRLSETTP